MPVLNVPNYGPVSFPDDMPQDEIQEHANTISNKYAYKPDYSQQGIGTIASNAVQRGIASLVGPTATGLEALAGSALGFKDFGKQKLEQAAQEQQAIEEAHPTAYKSYHDIKGIGDVPAYLAENIGEMAPDLAAMMLSGGVGSAIAKRGTAAAIEAASSEAAKKAAIEAAQKLGQRGATAGTYAGALSLNAPNTLQNIYAKTGEVDPGIATVFGAGQAALDTLIPMKIREQLSKGASDKLVAQLINSSTLPDAITRPILKAAAATTVEGGSIQAAKEASNILAEHIAGAPDEENKADRILSSFISGAAGTSLLGLPGAISEGTAKKTAYKNEVARRQAADQAFANAPSGTQREMFGEAPQGPVQPEAPIESTEAIPSPGPAQTAFDFEGKVDQETAALRRMGQQPPDMERRAATAETFSNAQPDLFGDVLPPKEPLQEAPPAPPTVPSEQGTLPLVGGRTAPEMARDQLIGQKNQEQVQAAQDIAHQRDVQDRINAQTALGEAAQEQLKLQSGLETTNRMVESENLRRAEQTRRGIIESILNDPATVNPKERIEAEFARQGLANPKMTPDELTYAQNHKALNLLFGEQEAKEVSTDWRTLRDMELEPPQESEPTPTIVSAPQAKPAEETKLVSKEEKAPPPAADPKALAEAYLGKVDSGEVNPNASILKGHINKLGLEMPETGKGFTDRAVDTLKEHLGIKEAENVRPTDMETNRVSDELSSRPSDEQTAGRTSALTNDRVATDTRVTPELTGRTTAPSPALELREKPTNTTAEAAAFDRYLNVPSVMGNVKKALEMIAHEVVNKTPAWKTSTKESEAAARSLGGKNTKLAEGFVRKALDPKHEAYLEKQLKKEQARSEKLVKDDTRRHEELAIDKQREEARQKLAEANAEQFDEENPSKRSRKQDKKLARELEDVGQDIVDEHHVDALISEIYFKPSYDMAQHALNSLAEKLHPEVVHQLSEGNLRGALNIMKDQLSPMLARNAGDLLRSGAEPKVKIVEGLGKPGEYDPTTNTILLDSKMGLNAHVVLHEMTHAATSHIIDNPSHPVTKQLTKLFDAIKNKLDTAYGAKDLHEFVAEAFSNPEFQQKLGMLTPEGERISAWQKFTNIVGNFVRRLMGMEPRNIESAHDATDRLINEILSPSPAYRDAATLNMAVAHPQGKEAHSLFERVAEAAKHVGLYNEAIADKIHMALTSATSNRVRNGIMSMLPLHALTDQIKTVLPNAPKLNDLINQQHGDMYKRLELLKPVIERADSWAKSKNKDAIDSFNKLVGESTVNQVDPTKPSSTYETQPKKLQVWNELQPHLNKIGDTGKELYADMRDTYQKIYADVRDSIMDRVKSVQDMDPTAKEKVVKGLMATLSERSKVDPYFPLTRKGDYWLSYNVLNEKGQVVDRVDTTFETPRAREREMALLNKVGGVSEVTPYTKFNRATFSSAPETSFANRILGIMEAGKVPSDVQEQVLDTVLRTMPESSFVQQFNRRKANIAGTKGITGYNTDAIGVFKEKSQSMARQVSRMKYSGLLRNMQSEFAKDVKALEQKGGNDLAVQYMNELNKRIEFAIKPESMPVSNFINSMGFAYFMGGNLSSAVVNLAQVPMFVAPYLAGDHGWAETHAALDASYKLFIGSGSTHTTKDILGKEATLKVGRSLENYENNIPKDMPELATLIRVAGERGELNRNDLNDRFGNIIENKGNASMLQRFNAASGYFMQHSERMNRQVTLAASYMLELKKIKADPQYKGLSDAAHEELAAQKAVYITEMTNGGTAAAAAPRISQNAIGRVLFMFKKYGAAMMYLQYQAAKDIFSKEPKLQKMALQRTIGLYGMAGLFAGLQGMPMMGTASLIYNLFKDPDDPPFGFAMNEAMGDLLTKGPVQAMTGVNIAPRLSMTDLLFREDTKPTTGAQEAMQQLQSTFGGPAFSLGMRLARGTDDIQNGNIERGVEQLLPSSLGNIFRGTRFMSEGATTVRGDPIVNDVDAAHAVAQMIGFAPADYAKAQEEAQVAKGMDKVITGTSKKLLNRINVAKAQGDMEGADIAREEFKEWVDKYPELGSPNTMEQNSWAAFKKASKDMFHGVSLNSKLRKRIEEEVEQVE